MKNFLLFLLILIIFFVGLPLSNSNKIYAANECFNVTITAKMKDGTVVADPELTDGTFNQINWSFNTATKEKFMVVIPYSSGIGFIVEKQGEEFDFNNTNSLSGTLNYGDYWGKVTAPGQYIFNVWVDRGNGWERYGDDSCKNIGYEILPAPTPTPLPENCTLEISPSSDIRSNTEVTITVKSSFDLTKYVNDLTIRKIDKKNDEIESRSYVSSNVKTYWNDGIYDVTFQGFSPSKSINYNASPTIFCSSRFTVCNKGCGVPTPTPSPTPTPITPTPTIPVVCGGLEGYKAQERGDCSSTYTGCRWCITPTPKSKIPNISIPNLKPLCDQLPTENAYRDKCWTCQKTGGIWSAIGCLPTDFSALIKEKVFPVGLGIAGGVAFLYFLYGAFMILTSSGNAEKMEEAKQIITSSLAGLLLIIFSIFLLQVIGVQILQLPGFVK